MHYSLPDSISLSAITELIKYQISCGLRRVEMELWLSIIVNRRQCVIYNYYKSWEETMLDMHMEEDKVCLFNIF